MINLNRVPKCVYHFFKIMGEKFLRRYKRFLPYQKWLVVVFFSWIISLIFIINLELKSDFTKYPQTLYLLSALAQSLAAIFALVFTISLVAAQLFSRYSHRMLTNLFDPLTIGYISLFILTIMFSLVAINKAENVCFVKFVLSISSLSFLLLIPYFLRFKEHLNPEYTLENLRKAAENKIKENPSVVPSEISNIDNFVMSALVLKDYDTFNKGIVSLEDIAKTIVIEVSKMEESEKNQINQIFSTITSNIGDITISSIDDPRAPRVAIHSLKTIGVICSNNKLDFYSMFVCGILGDIGVKAVQVELTALIDDPWLGVYNGFLNITKAAIETRLEQTIIMAGQSLGNIGVEAARNKNNEIAYHAASEIKILIEDIMDCDFNISSASSNESICISLTWQIKNIGIQSVENHLEDAAGWIATYLSIIGEKAVLKRFEKMSIEAATGILVMGLRACDKRLEITLESVTRCLYDVGVKSINANINGTSTSVINGLYDIAISANKYSLTSTLQRSTRFLIELGVTAIRAHDNAARDLIAEKLKQTKRICGTAYMDMHFIQLESTYAGQNDYLQALTVLKNLST